MQTLYGVVVLISGVAGVGFAVLVLLGLGSARVREPAARLPAGEQRVRTRRIALVDRRRRAWWRSGYVGVERRRGDRRVAVDRRLDHVGQHERPVTIPGPPADATARRAA